MFCCGSESLTQKMRKAEEQSTCCSPSGTKYSFQMHWSDHIKDLYKNDYEWNHQIKFCKREPNRRTVSIFLLGYLHHISLLVEHIKASCSPDYFMLLPYWEYESSISALNTVSVYFLVIWETPVRA